MTGAPTLPPGYRLIVLETVDSTNEEAKRLARTGAAARTVVWARAQTAGRGRSGRNWVSPQGNLYLSLVLRPEVPAGRATELGFVAAVAAGEALQGLIGPGVRLNYKWPNDILLNDRKVAGFLLEAETGLASRGGGLEWLVLGLGINLRACPENTEFPATCLDREGAGGVPVEAVLEAFLGRFAEWERRWARDGFAPVRQAWKGSARGIGQDITVRLPNASLRGKFIDLDADGALLLGIGTGAGETRRITAGDVFFG